jgi:hypothetical protein
MKRPAGSSAVENKGQCGWMNGSQTLFDTAGSSEVENKGACGWMNGL